jgi:hypothetical protein
MPPGTGERCPLRPVTECRFRVCPHARSAAAVCSASPKSSSGWGEAVAVIVKRGKSYGVKVYVSGQQKWVGTFKTRWETREAERTRMSPV